MINNFLQKKYLIANKILTNIKQKTQQNLLLEDAQKIWNSVKDIKIVIFFLLVFRFMII